VAYLSYIEKIKDITKYFNKYNNLSYAEKIKKITYFNEL